MSRNADPKVIIVGAGIGGLCLAIALRQHGHQPIVLERAPQLEAVGAGITLFPNAMSGLELIGVADLVRSAGAPSTHCTILTSQGCYLTNVPSAVLKGTVAIHRGELQKVLLNTADDVGVEVQVGMEVTSIEQSDQEVTAKMANGSERHGHLLVGADGIWSTTRRSVAPCSPSYGGYIAYRGVSPIEIEPGHIAEFLGIGGRFGFVDIGSRTYWFATANALAGNTDEPNGRKAHLMRRFADWHPEIAKVLDATPDDSILRNDVHYLQPLPRWNERRIALLGDAAHASTPGIGQGAGQAIEDAAVLAEKIGGPDRLNDLPQLRDSLARYESIRRPRANLALKLSLRADRVSQLDRPFAVRVRNLAVAHTPSRLQTREMNRLVHPELIQESPVPQNRRLGSASSTAAAVASMRAGMERPSSPGGDTEAAHQLALSLNVRRRARRTPVLRRYVEGRTRFFDTAVAEAISQVSQIVIVGAGYDDRSMRFRTPGVQFIEVDHPATQLDKRTRLDQLGIESSDIKYISVDLAVESIDGALRNVVNCDRSVAFVCEAIMPYLPYERVRNLLAGLGELCPPASFLYIDPALLPNHPLGQIAFSVVKLLTRISGERLYTVLSKQEMDRLLAETGWKEQARLTGHALGMPRLAADSLCLRLSRTPQP